MARGERRLHEHADEHKGHLETETLDIANEHQRKALRERLQRRTSGMLIVNAGTTNKNPMEAVGEVTTEEFVGRCG